MPLYIWPTASAIPQPAPTNPTSEQYDRMTAAAMSFLRERRHIARPEIESEKSCRQLVAEILEAANG